MTSKAAVDAFMASRRLAFVGASRSGKGFGHHAYRELKAKGYELFPVHPAADLIQGDPCARSLMDLAGKVDGVVVVVPPPEALKVVQQAHAAGIGRVWLQQGAESTEAVAWAREHGMDLVQGECVLMFLEHGAWIHRAHRGLRRLVGRLPA
ncbi:MAG: hypothetical protein AMXMBFR64_01670 [Myxococcales bacterium]